VIRLLLWLVIAATFVVCGSTVKLGKRTLFGHISAIWNTDEAQDAKEGIKEKAGPVMDKVERAGKKAIDELKKDEPAKGSGEVPAH
jgi:hypothetical protein